MRRILPILGAAAMSLVAPALVAQDLKAGQPTGTGNQAVAPGQDLTPPAGSLVLHTTTQLVLVDVLVRDRDGRPVHGLTRDQFQVTEGQAPQTVRSFEEFSANPGAVSAGIAAPAPSQPPGTFVVGEGASATGPLYVLLADALNTPTNAQDYLRQQLTVFLQHMPPGVRIAIFGLNGNLVFLQGFSSDPAVLLEAVEHRMPAKSSVLLADPNGTNEQPELLALIKGKMKENVERTDRNAEGFAIETRLRLTVDAFSALGRYLAAFPGRKNLLWFSGSFPMNLIPDPGMPSSSQSVLDTEAELRTMTNVLTRAEVSLYPVDARGIVPSPTFDAGCHCGKYVKPGGALVKDTYKEDTQHGDELATMDTLADQTGGHAFYRTNDLASATAKAIDLGANYYNLSYAPANHDWDGRYREIRVKLTGPAAAMRYTLSYRRGYYGTDPNRSVHGVEAALAGARPSTENQSDRTVALALLHGAPAASDLPFKVRILPAARQTEATVVPGNHLSPGVPMQGPFQRYSVDFLAAAQHFTFNATGDGQRTGEVRLMALVYDADGHLLNSTSGGVPLHLSPDAYAQLLHDGVPIHVEISVPTKRDAYLRVALEDGPSDRMGVLEIPVAEVSRLDPPAAAEAAHPVFPEVAANSERAAHPELAADPEPPSALPASAPTAASVPATPSQPEPSAARDATRLASAAVSTPAAPALFPQPNATPAPSAAAPDPGQPFTLHVYEQLIQVPTLVLNSAQNSYRDLRPEGFWVQLDGGPAFHPKHVHMQNNDPMSIAVLLDVSGNQPGTLAQRLPAALPRLRPDLLSPSDHLSVFAYDCGLIRSKDNAPGSAETLQAGIAAAFASPQLHTAGGGTSCSSNHPLLATMTAVIANMQNMPGRRVLLVVSDRIDAGSPETQNAAWRVAAAANVTVFGIRPPPHEVSPEIRDVYRIRHRHEDGFAEVCAHTGGLDLYSAPTDLAASVSDVVSMVRNRYILEFQRPAKGNAGEHEIAVRVLDNNALIRIGTAVYPGKDAFGSEDPNTVSTDLSRAPVYGDRKPSAAQH